MRQSGHDDPCSPAPPDNADAHPCERHEPEDDRHTSTPAWLLALPPTVDIPTAGRLLGIGRALAYRLARDDKLPCRVLRLGHRYVVPRADLLRCLGVTANADGARPLADHRSVPRQARCDADTAYQEGAAEETEG